MRTRSPFHAICAGAFVGLIALTTALAQEPALFAPGVISTGDDESHPAFTPDGKTLYFLKNTPSFDHWTIVVSHLRDGTWITPEVAPFSGQYRDADPFITADGERFFFISNRPVNGKPKEDNDIWVMKRTSTGWGEPEHLEFAGNSEANEWFPTLTKDGTLYFGSERKGGKGRSDIWRSKFVDGQFAEPENLGEPVNTTANEVEPFIAPDETFMIFAASGRPDGKGAYDLFVTCNNGGKWTAPENLPINSTGWDFSPKMSPDGKRFFFTSNRSFTDEPLTKRLDYAELLQKLHSPMNGLRDIYEVDVSALKLKR